MWRFFALILSLIASANTVQLRLHEPYSAASQSQIRFAVENRYDDTGPGAKEPEYAYNTYKTLQEALISYLDDPDTKLPEPDKQKALASLNGGNPYGPPPRQLPKTVEEYTGYKSSTPAPAVLNQFRPQQKPIFYQDPSTNYGYLDLRGLDASDLTKTYFNQKLNDAFSFRKVQPVKSSPLSLAQYTRPRPAEIKEVHDEFDANPQYSFSYGVHDKHTGDSKAAHESRDGGSVRGYYSFVDPDGKLRTVHYTADDRLGFRATVQRTQMNTQ